jgi:hypothetical protein
VLNGGADDDILALLDPAFLEGFGTGVSLDLGAIPDTRIQGIERVDLGGQQGGEALSLQYSSQPGDPARHPIHAVRCPARTAAGRA